MLRLGDVWYDSSPATAAVSVSTPAPPATGGTFHGPLVTLIIQLLVVVVATQGVGSLAGFVRQPAVIGEMAAGILIGPSLLGHVSPAALHFVFPQHSLEILRLMSQIGVILFMFTVGLDLNPSHLRQRAPTAIAVSHFSIVVPFILGVSTALIL